VPLATTIITQAFADDPVWGPALRRSDGAAIDLQPYWRLFVEGSIRFGTARMTDDRAAVAIWIPPGEAELSDDSLAELDRFIARSLDERARKALETLYERFEASRAGRADHYYLSLLATHPAHRGRGRGQQLLAEGLAAWDAEGVPAYLESTNPANDHRYERAGFRKDGGFAAVLDDAPISAMWRKVGGA
jgi:GNAT superfamily N-acetyltransferase